MIPDALQECAKSVDMRRISSSRGVRSDRISFVGLQVRIEPVKWR